MKHTVDYSKPMQYYVTEDKIYVGQWDENHKGYMVPLSDLSEEIQKIVRNHLESKNVIHYSKPL